MRIVFISTMTGYPWGGSEELWSQTARRLREAGHDVAALVEDNPPRSPKLGALAEAGVAVRVRNRTRWALAKAVWTRATGRRGKDKDKEWLSAHQPQLVVISQGGISDGLDWMLFCEKTKLPYIPIVQSNNDTFWPDDHEASDMAQAYAAAQRVFCVARRNRQLLEWQVGAELPNARVVWNPNNVAAAALAPWPAGEEKMWLACVARLEPAAKGQDILFQVLALPSWRQRPVEVNLYGAGPQEQMLRRMAARLQLANVHFRGQASKIEEVWRENHLLVLPSRREGLPLTLVEAMSCGAAVVTDVGGNAELCVDGETGFVAAAAAVGPLAEALERAWVRRAEWEQMGRAAREHVLQIVPRDPVGDFGELLLESAGLGKNHS